LLIVVRLARWVACYAAACICGGSVLVALRGRWSSLLAVVCLSRGWVSAVANLRQCGG
jgi:hypothetical protein